MKYIFLLLATILGFAKVYSQQNTAFFQKLTANNGLSQGHVLCMIQDREGYIWAGTYFGLNRYNGYNFDTFYSDPKNPNSITIDVVYSLFEDSKGKIWAGTWGIDIFDPETESIIKHIPAEKGPNSISTGEVSCMAEDQNGIMWLGTRIGGLNKYNPKTEQITWIRADTSKLNALQSNQINDIQLDKNGFLWIATDGGGLSKLNIADDQIQTYKHKKCDHTGIPSNKITCIFEDSKGDLWFGDNFGVLFRYNEQNDQFTRVFCCKEDGKHKKVRIMQIAQDMDGNLLLATNGMGLIKFNPETEKTNVYLHESYNNESIVSNENWSVLVSKTNTVFVGSYGRGMSVYSPYNNKFDVFKLSRSEMEGKEANAFTDAIEDKKGHLITGTYNGFLVFDQNTWEYEHYLPGTTYEENKILTLTQGPDGDIWLTSPRCLYRYDQNFKKLGSFVFDSTLKDHEIFALAFDHYDNLWVGLFIKGLLKISKQQWQDKSKKVLDYKIYLKDDANPKSISSNQHWTFFIDSDSSFYIGGLGGLDKYNYETDDFTRIYYPGTIKSIDKDSQGRFWLGTIGNGLYCYDTKTSESIKYTKQNGLKHGFIYSTIADSFNNIWITSEAGLTRLNIPTGKFRNYDQRDGLPDYHFDDKSESKLSGGRLYMGTNNGFVIFRPELISEDSSAANVVLSSLYIDNQKVLKYTNKRSNSTQSIPVSKIKTIDLESDQRDIEFRFAAMHYAAPHKILYSYKLEGYDKKWIDTDAYKREAKYTNLEGGKYTFILKASNSNGIWNSDPLVINLIVHPPFYDTLAFKIFGIVLAFAVIYLYFKLRLIGEQRQNLKLSQKVKERTIEISEKNQQLHEIAEDLKQTNSQLQENQDRIEQQRKELLVQRDELALSNATKDKLFSVIAHDLKAPFNVILGFNQLLIDRFKEWSPEKQLQTLQLLKESSTNAYTLLENLLQWSKSQSGSIRFYPQKVRVNEIINNALEELVFFANRKDLKLVNLAENNNVLFEADLNMFNTIMRNLILNSIKYSFRGKVIEINAVSDGSKLLFSVKDEGMGMSLEKSELLFNPGAGNSKPGTEGEKGSGIGLILCKDFVSYHKGKIWVESIENKGCTVFFTIPLPESEN